MKIKRILMPTDFSPCSEVALDQAILWARLFSAEIHLLHVITLHSVSDPNAAFPSLEDLHDHLDQFAVGELAKFKEMDPLQGLKLHTERRRAITVAPEIVAYAEEHEIDLIVLGTHGLRGLRRFMMGSVAEEVIRTAGCPVLTVRGSKAGKADAIQRILVPFDFSTEAKQSLLEVEGLAKVNDAKIDLLHVAAAPIPPGSYASIPLPAAHYDSLAELMEKNLRELAEESALAAKIEVHVLVGNAAWEICDFADKAGSNLIVLTSHGLSGLNRILLGSVSEKVARMAECPVLILRKPEAPESESA